MILLRRVQFQFGHIITTILNSNLFTTQAHEFLPRPNMVKRRTCQAEKAMAEFIGLQLEKNPFKIDSTSPTEVLPICQSNSCQIILQNIVMWGQNCDGGRHLRVFLWKAYLVVCGLYTYASCQSHGIMTLFKHQYSQRQRDLLKFYCLSFVSRITKSYILLRVNLDKIMHAH